MKQIVLIDPSKFNFNYNAIKKSIVSYISKKLMREVNEEELKGMITDVRIIHNQIALDIKL